MGSSMYGLEVEFIQKQGTFMLMHKEGALRIADFAEHQIKMLQYNAVPRTLHIELEQVDEQYRLYYNITSKRMLSQVMRVSSMTLSQYFHMLTQIVTVLADSKIYMLDESSYILHEDFIFVDQELNQIYLTYLPLSSIPSKTSLQTDFRELLSRLISSISEIQGTGIQQLMKFVKEEQFSIYELKQMLNRLMMDRFENEQALPRERADLGHKDKEKTKGEREKVYHPPQNQTYESNQFPRVGNHNKPLIICGYIAACALLATIWKVYATFQNEGLVYICLGITLLIIDALFIMQKVLWNKTEHAANELGHGNSAPLNITMEPRLPNLNATVMLSKFHALELEQLLQYNKAYLEIMREDHATEEVSIEGESFIIGREASAGVHYVENTIGVSRAHCEIFCDSNGYGVKDLGSSNGSFLNDEALVPYKLYPLKHGDVIKIIKTEMIFYITCHSSE